ncbi:hypothetical protein FJ960_01910 [Mesorhizobium sp. B2-3-11]|uniref:hypothetical protein n=1 Tax=Mesorhizobium sp. B2-3-11 TaxID=2589953 RepID=UPI001129DFC0|nr:hypothetical protein [Mesorhizobium sp. B2-3-11]TPM11522.1 hypothetical protein FJ960_01910 [Mesorhizobium sp. B2-3-11]
MPAKRTPLRRDVKRRITPAAIAAFKAGDEMALHELLGLRPWEISPIGCDEGDSPYPPGSAGHSTWPQAQELRQELEALTR